MRTWEPGHIGLHGGGNYSLAWRSVGDVFAVKEPLFVRAVVPGAVMMTAGFFAALAMSAIIRSGSSSAMLLGMAVVSTAAFLTAAFPFINNIGYRRVIVHGESGVVRVGSQTIFWSRMSEFSLRDVMLLEHTCSQGFIGPSHDCWTLFLHAPQFSMCLAVANIGDEFERKHVLGRTPSILASIRQAGPRIIVSSVPGTPKPYIR